MSCAFLIRHGKPASAWGGGDDDPGLELEGEAQAESAARSLLDLPRDERPIRVASSPMRRCLETARPLADALGVNLEIVPEVGEIPTPVAVELVERGRWLRRALQGDWSDIIGDLDYQVWRRTVAEAVRRRPRAAIFSHFVAINAVVSLLRGDQAVTVFRPGYASITTLCLVANELSLSSLGSEAATGIL